jgi:hypothetical protein
VLDLISRGADPNGIDRLLEALIPLLPPPDQRLFRMVMKVPELREAWLLVSGSGTPDNELLEVFTPLWLSREDAEIQLLGEEVVTRSLDHPRAILVPVTLITGTVEKAQEWLKLRGVPDDRLPEWGFAMQCSYAEFNHEVLKILRPAESTVGPPGR